MTGFRFAVFLMLLPMATAVGQNRPKDTKVDVKLTCSVEEYDLAKPSQSTIKCVVHNHSAEAVQVPTSYDGNRIQLSSTNRLILNRTTADEDRELERQIADLQRQLVGSDDPDMILALAHRLADAIKAKKAWEAKSLVAIAPGQERKVFEFPLYDLLLNGQTKDGSVKWGWTLRPAPPKSPIYRKAGSRDLVSEASFTVRLQVGGQIVDSNTVRLIVKNG